MTVLSLRPRYIGLFADYLQGRQNFALNTGRAYDINFALKILGIFDELAKTPDMLVHIVNGKCRLCDGCIHLDETCDGNDSEEDLAVVRNLELVVGSSYTAGDIIARIQRKADVMSAYGGDLGR
ncbi:MAG TPA: DUF1284 domain-containing protein [Nanoarchaeota archaeon]|nr:DUF1284 domain-containing protein [Nanoarchaeota archaeon]